jgi:hypothetical protein
MKENSVDQIRSSIEHELTQDSICTCVEIAKYEIWLLSIDQTGSSIYHARL